MVSGRAFSIAVFVDATRGERLPTAWSDAGIRSAGALDVGDPAPCAYFVRIPARGVDAPVSFVVVR